MRKQKKISNILAIFIILIIVLLILGYYILKKLYPKEYSEYVEKYSTEYNVDKDLIYAIIKEESNFNSDISSSKSAIGLMQLVQSTADEVRRRTRNGEHRFKKSRDKYKNWNKIYLRFNK